MATSSGNYTSEALLATDRYFSRKVVDQVFKSNALLFMMRKNADLIDGGTSIELPHLTAATPDFTWFSEYETYTVSQAQQFDAGRLPWTYGTQPVLISEAELLKNSSSKLRRMRHVRLKNMAASKTMADTFATAMFALDYTNSGSYSGKAIDSIDLAVNDGSGSGAETGYGTATYAGIGRGSGWGATYWLANVDDTTTTTSLGALQQSYGDATEGDDHPTVAVTSQTGFNRYWNLLTPTQRQGTDLMGEIGFQSLLFNGIPVVVDSHVPRYLGANDTDADADQDYWYFLNLNYLRIVAHQNAFFKFRPSPMPVNQWVHIGRYYFMGNVVCDAPRYQSKLTHLTA